MTDDADRARHSPAGFEVPEPEVDNGMVVCSGCGEASPVDEMAATADHLTRNYDGAVIDVTRKYVHDDEDCMMALLGIEEDNDQ